MRNLGEFCGKNSVNFAVSSRNSHLPGHSWIIFPLLAGALLETNVHMCALQVSLFFVRGSEGISLQRMGPCATAFYPANIGLKIGKNSSAKASLVSSNSSSKLHSICSLSLSLSLSQKKASSYIEEITNSEYKRFTTSHHWCVFNCGYEEANTPCSPIFFFFFFFWQFLNIPFVICAFQLWVAMKASIARALLYLDTFCRSSEIFTQQLSYASWGWSL